MGVKSSNVSGGKGGPVKEQKSECKYSFITNFSGYKE